MQDCLNEQARHTKVKSAAEARVEDDSARPPKPKAVKRSVLSDQIPPKPENFTKQIKKQRKPIPARKPARIC